MAKEKVWEVSMIKEIDKHSINMCQGGKGECQCKGTSNPNEVIYYGPLTRILENEEACRCWCLNEEKGTKWRFTRNDGIYDFLKGALGFGGVWRSGVNMHLKVS